MEVSQGRLSSDLRTAALALSAVAGVVIITGALLAAAGCSGAPTKSGTKEKPKHKSIFTYVPANVDTIGMLRFKKLVDEGIIKEVLDSAKTVDSSDTLPQKLAEIGLDLERDLTSIVFFGRNTSGVMSAEPDGAAILRGKFNQDLIYKSIRNDMPEITDTTIQGRPGLATPEGQVFVIPEPGFFLIGSADAVEASLTSSKGDSPHIKSDSPLLARYKATRSKLAWGAGRVEVPPETMQNLPANPMIDFSKVLPDFTKVKNVFVSLDVESGNWTVAVDLRCVDAAAATETSGRITMGAGMVTGLVGMLAGNKHPEVVSIVTEIMGSLSVTANDKISTVTLKIPRSIVDKIKAETLGKTGSGLATAGGSLFPLRISSNETSAVASLVVCLAGQATFHKMDNYGIGSLVYANTKNGKGFADLYECKMADGRVKTVGMIDKALARATSSATPKAGYWFCDITGTSDGPYDPVIEYGICAVPAEHGKTGRNTFIMDVSGSIYQKDNGGKAIRTWPKDLAGEGWIPVGG